MWHFSKRAEFNSWIRHNSKIMQRRVPLRTIAVIQCFVLLNSHKLLILLIFFWLPFRTRWITTLLLDNYFVTVIFVYKALKTQTFQFTLHSLCNKKWLEGSWPENCCNGYVSGKHFILSKTTYLAKFHVVANTPISPGQQYLVVP